ncbi:thiamine pyrophosphate enzyme-like protein [Peribacillus asahii]|uniref:Thiamine pyrophosphate enzyme-like protein n=1 Tax=Peribacillus asahii TaxID=228899 RepID=A0A3Q9RK59_9BACI|nr:thiamine pyrophosphate enzyme-like protein [Peribacillus asahii]
MNTGVQRSGTTPKWSWTQMTPLGNNSNGKSQNGNRGENLKLLKGE